MPVVLLPNLKEIFLFIFGHIFIFLKQIHIWWQDRFISFLWVTLKVFFNWAPYHEGILGSEGTAPHIFDLGTRWRWVVSFLPWTQWWGEKFPVPARTWNPNHPDHSPATYHFNLLHVCVGGLECRIILKWVWSVYWIQLAQDINSNGEFLWIWYWNSANFFTSWVTIYSSRKNLHQICSCIYYA